MARLFDTLINFTFLCVANFMLAVIVFVLQLVDLILFSDDLHERIGAGIWSGIIFGVTGFVTRTAVTNVAQGVLILAIVSIFAGLSVVLIFIESLVFVGDCTVLDPILCPGRIVLDSSILICGVSAMIFNSLLAFSARSRLNSVSSGLNTFHHLPE